MKRICLGCTHYHLHNSTEGRCRIDRDHLDKDQYPVVGHNDTCDRWRDAGQRYYIRLGWLKTRKDVQGEPLQPRG